MRTQNFHTTLSIILLTLCLLLAGCSALVEDPPTQTPTPEPTSTTAPTATPTPKQVLPTQTPTPEPTATNTPTATETEMPPTQTPTITPTATNTEEPQEGYLDFSTIAGKWKGSACEPNNTCFWVEMGLESGAWSESEIGWVRYGVGYTTQCTGIWYAIRAQDSRYEVREEITDGPCFNGLVKLRYRPESPSGEILRYNYAPIPHNERYVATGGLSRND